MEMILMNIFINNNKKMKKYFLITLFASLWCISINAQNDGVGLHIGYGMGIDTYSYGISYNHIYKNNVEFHPSINLFHINDDHIEQTSLDIDWHYLIKSNNYFLQFISLYPIAGVNFSYSTNKGDDYYDIKIENKKYIRKQNVLWEINKNYYRLGLDYGIGIKFDIEKLSFSWEYKYNLIKTFHQNKFSMNVTYNY
jgi:hypothetical protein